MDLPLRVQEVKHLLDLFYTQLEEFISSNFAETKDRQSKLHEFMTSNLQELTGVKDAVLGQEDKFSGLSQQLLQLQTAIEAGINLGSKVR
jgi:hypothetical protein